jgi:hypothetical protein
MLLDLLVALLQLASLGVLALGAYYSVGCLLACGREKCWQTCREHMFDEGGCMMSRGPRDRAARPVLPLRDLRPLRF